MADAGHFFSVTDKARIEAAVKVVETTTAGEIAVMVVDESDTYPEGIVLGSALLGGLAALVFTDLLFNDSLGLYIPCTAVLAVLAGFTLKRLKRLHRFFIPAEQMNRRVQARAEQAFYAKGLHKTRDASGVLFFLSLFERKVWVLADQGIYQKISPEELQTYATHVVSGIKSGRPAEALCAEIARVGQVLALHFPIRAGDTNELSNEVLHEASVRP